MRRELAALGELIGPSIEAYNAVDRMALELRPGEGREPASDLGLRTYLQSVVDTPVIAYAQAQERSRCRALAAAERASQMIQAACGRASADGMVMSR